VVVVKNALPGQKCWGKTTFSVSSTGYTLGPQLLLARCCLWCVACRVDSTLCRVALSPSLLVTGRVASTTTPTFQNAKTMHCHNQAPRSLWLQDSCGVCPLFRPRIGCAGRRFDGGEYEERRRSNIPDRRTALPPGATPEIKVSQPLLTAQHIDFYPSRRAGEMATAGRSEFQGGAQRCMDHDAPHRPLLLIGPRP